MFQSPSSWEAGGLSYLLCDSRFPSLYSTRHPFLQLPHTRRTFVRVELSSVPALLGWAALANCSSSTTPSLLDIRQHRTSAGHVKAVSAVVRPLLEHYIECRHNARKYRHTRNTPREYVVGMSFMGPCLCYAAGVKVRDGCCSRGLLSH